MKKLNELQSYLTRLRGLMLTLIILCSIGIGNVWGETATFTISGKSGSSSPYTVTGTLSGAPTGATASCTNTYNNANQITKDNSMTLTLTGFDGCTITGVSISAHNNAKSGNGSGSLTINGSSKGSVSSLSGMGTSWTNKNFTVTSTVVNTSATVVVTLSCSPSSLYCQSFTITYTAAAVSKTFTLAVPKGDGTYDETQIGQEKTALTEANAIKKRNCGGGDLDGYYANIWTSTAINTPTSTYPSPVYTSSTADGSLPASGTKLYPVFTNDAGKYLTNPSCAAVKTLSSIAITTAPTTTKYLVGETFSSTGTVVTATYSDATTANVSASTSWTPTTGLVAGSNTITASYTEGGVTKTATTTVTAYSVTVQKKDEDGTTIADAGVTASASGRTLTASAGSTHYVFKTWKYGTASGTSIASATSASTSLTGTPSAAVTVIAEFYKPCTVTWSVNGSTYTTTANVSYNTTTSTPANPSVPGECTGSTFMGWTANSSWASDSAPGDLFNGTTPTITGNITFYAVFADEE